MPSQPPDAERYFATVADSYDRLQPILAGPSYSMGLDMIVELLPHDWDATFGFVELGCGTAEPTMRVLQRFQRATGTCIDTEPEMLELARRKLASHGDRAQVRQGDMMSCDIPTCDVIFSAKAIHHVSPTDLPGLLGRIVGALRPNGCLILYDGMLVGPQWGASIRALSARFRGRHIQTAIDAGQATQAEVHARREYKRNMKAAGKDTEYRHTADDILSAMVDAGFAETGIMWRMLTDTILMAFTSGQNP